MPCFIKVGVFKICQIMGSKCLHLHIKDVENLTDQVLFSLYQGWPKVNFLPISIVIVKVANFSDSIDSIDSNQ